MMGSSIVLIYILAAILQIVIIVSIVHISAKSDEAVKELKAISEKLDKISQSSKTAELSNSDWTCPFCGNINPEWKKVCIKCDKVKPH